MTDIQSDIKLENRIADMVNNPSPPEPKPELSKYYKLNNEHFMFLNRLQYVINKNHNIHEFINRQWIQTFPGRSFPEGRTLQQLKVALQYGIVLNAYRNYHIKATEKFLENCRRSTDFSNGVDNLTNYLDRCEKYNTLSKIIINPITFTQGELNMTTKKKKNIVKLKAKEKKAVINKAVERKDFCKKLLLEQKFNDDEILAKVNKNFPGQKPEFNKSRIGTCRFELNKGSSKKFPKPTKPIVRLGAPVAKAKTKPSGKVEPKAKAKKKVKAKSK